MNWQHIEAVLKGNGYFNRMNFADVDGKRILTDGHIAFVFNGEFPFDDAKATPIPSLPDLWRKHAAMDCAPTDAGECRGEGQGIRRMFGDTCIAERFVRCLGRDSQWTVRGESCPAIVHRNGEMIALVMPMRNGGELLPIGEPTDEQVFSPFGSEDNGWYLQTKQELAEQIERAERDASNARIAVEEADADLEDAERELKALRAKARAAK